LLLAACDTLDVGNPNAPDSRRLLSDPATVQSIALGAMRTWYNVHQDYDPNMVQIVMARSHVASWNNFQIRFYTGCTLGAWTTYGAPLGTCGTTTSTYPRIEWQNDPASSQRLQIENFWYGYYSALSSANDVLKAIRVNNVLIQDAKTTKMVETLAELLQGLCLGGLALNYDKAFIVDYNTDLLSLQFSPRAAMRDAALAKLDTAIAFASGNAFTVPDAFFNSPGVSYDNVKVAQIANTMAAQLLAYYPRSAAENATVNWTRVVGYASKGISSGTRFDWVFKSDQINWNDNLKQWSNDMTTVRIHTRVAHLMSPNTQPDPYAGDAANTQPVWGTSSFDKRLGDGSYGPVGNHAGVPGPGGLDSVTGTPAATANAGTDYAWSRDKSIMPTARGQWHQSAIGQIRYITLGGSDPNGTLYGYGPGPVVLAAENDLIWAEALIRSGGSAVTTAGLINNSRVTRGGLAALTGAETQAALLTALQYEQDVELPGSNNAPYYNQRRIDNLEPLTPHEFPVPAKELGVLGLPLYTWGGSGAPNSGPTAPAPGAAALMQNAPQIWAQLRQEGQARWQASRILDKLLR
jgi:hypothetical protein